jgi:diadenylate cyclase
LAIAASVFAEDPRTGSRRDLGTLTASWRWATDRKRDERLLVVLQQVAPGKALREGLERILRASTGALIVLGDSPEVKGVLSGGFPIDVEFTAQRLSELAKMDGAMVLSADAGRILFANVHLVPDAAIPTQESGTRHRTAERVAKQTGAPVVSVSQSMRIVTLYVGGLKYVLEEISSILARGNQALQTLERYKLRLDEVFGALSALEVEDLVTLRDVVAVIQRIEMVRRIADEIDLYITELGADGRLLRLLLDELLAHVEDDRMLVAKDYLVARRGVTVSKVLAELDAISTEELLDLPALARALNHQPTPEALEITVSSRGFRLLSKIPRLPGSVIEKLVGHFQSLERLMGASLEELDEVEGVGETRAKAIKEGLSRLAEASILERYV